MAWLFRHTLMGSLGDAPPSATRRRRWGAGEIEQLYEGTVHNGRTMLRLEQVEGESWAAFLSFARFPDLMAFPEGEPWLHYADSLPFPVEVSSRMHLVPPAKASKDVSRRLAHARDMDAHIREAGAEAPIALAEQIAAARMLEHGITKERLPFVYGWHRLIVTAPTRELCVRRVEAVTEHYRDIGIDLVNSTGDQFSLLSESLPGERVRLSSYVQRQPLYTIAGGMPTATVELGDRIADGVGWIGPYIGETLGRARSVVHFDPMLAAARNRPTAVAITGEPGGGKTTLAMLLIYQLALRGATIAVIDPKGDAEPLAEFLSQDRAAGPGAAALVGRGRAARPVLVRRRPGGKADDGDRDAAPAAAEDERGAGVGDDPGRRRGGRRASAVARQGRQAPRGVRRPGLEEPRRGDALGLRDAPGQALLLAVGRAADRRRGVDDRVHARRPHPAGHQHGQGGLLVRAAALGGAALPGLPVRPAADEHRGQDRPEGDLPRRGVGDHVHARRARSWFPRCPGWGARGTRRSCSSRRMRGTCCTNR